MDIDRKKQIIKDWKEQGYTLNEIRAMGAIGIMKAAKEREFDDQVSLLVVGFEFVEQVYNED